MIARIIMSLAGILFAVNLYASEPQQIEANKPLPVGSEGTLVIADFDSWEEVNNVGGLFSSWTKNPEDITQGCRVEITDDDRWGNVGLCVRLIYDVDSPSIAYNGLWMLMEGADFSPYRYFVIHVRGDKEAGFSPRFKIELKNKAKEVGRYVVTGVTEDWKEFVIPLKNFKGMKNFKSIKEITITFDDMRCSPKLGQVLIDNIYLSK